MGEWEKLAKLRRFLSQVHFAKISFENRSLKAVVIWKYIMPGGLRTLYKGSDSGLQRYLKVQRTNRPKDPQTDQPTNRLAGVGSRLPRYCSWTNIVDEIKLDEEGTEQEGIGKPLVKWIIRMRKKKPWSAKRHSQRFHSERRQKAHKHRRCTSSSTDYRNVFWIFPQNLQALVPRSKKCYQCYVIRASLEEPFSVHILKTHVEKKSIL